MWMFTTIGFFSAVQVKPELHEKLELDESRAPWVMVRARVREDLVNLGEVCVRTGQEVHEILEWEGRDYPYRVIMPRSQWAVLVGTLAVEIDYPNFKSEVTKVQGRYRHTLYGRVWGVMYGAERWLKLEASKKVAASQLAFHEGLDEGFRYFDRRSKKRRSK